jgi:hypothetical protein
MTVVPTVADAPEPDADAVIGDAVTVAVMLRTAAPQHSQTDTFA